MHHDIQPFAEYAVTPLVGVWIETDFPRVLAQFPQVTPLVGVWIETTQIGKVQNSTGSHPSWVCGLKQKTNQNKVSVLGHTPRGCVD